MNAHEPKYHGPADYRGPVDVAPCGLCGGYGMHEFGSCTRCAGGGWVSEPRVSVDRKRKAALTLAGWNRLESSERGVGLTADDRRIWGALTGKWGLGRWCLGLPSSHPWADLSSSQIAANVDRFNVARWAMYHDVEGVRHA